MRLRNEDSNEGMWRRYEPVSCKSTVTADLRRAGMRPGSKKKVRIDGRYEGTGSACLALANVSFA
jgi:hypothetical protein